MRRSIGRNSVFSRHCSDAQLMAHLDGELSTWERGRVQSHLDVCWACRGRRVELERQAQEFALPFERGGVYGADWVKKAKNSFCRWRDHYEEVREPRPPSARRSVFPRALALAAAVGCLAIVGYEHSRRQPNAPTASKVIANVRRAEAEFEATSVPRAAYEQDRSVERQAERSLRFPVDRGWRDPVRNLEALGWQGIRAQRCTVGREPKAHAHRCIRDGCVGY